MIGSDGLPHDRHPHPRLWGAFPRVLRALLARARAVHAGAGGAQDDGPDGAQLPHRRPRTAAGRSLAADVVVFDPARVADTATYDAAGERKRRASAAVYVNGVRWRIEAGERSRRVLAARRPHAEPRGSSGCRLNAACRRPSTWSPSARPWPNSTSSPTARATTWPASAATPPTAPSPLPAWARAPATSRSWATTCSATQLLALWQREGHCIPMRVPRLASGVDTGLYFVTHGERPGTASRTTAPAAPRAA